MVQIIQKYENCGPCYKIDHRTYTYREENTCSARTVNNNKMYGVLMKK